MEEKKYVLNNCRTKKLKVNDENSILLTNDFGEWINVSEEEYRGILTCKISDQLFKTLEGKGIIITDENQDLICQKIKKKNSHLMYGTTLHIVVPTLRCNQSCIYCHSKAKALNAEGYDMDKETAEKTIDFIFQTPAKSISIEFQGGDALLNFDIVKHMIEYAKNVNKKKKKTVGFGIVTNLIAMDDEKLEYLLKHKVGICTSLDGPKELHDKNRPYKDSSYDIVQKWIREIMSKDKIKLHALLVITRHSLPLYKEIIDTYVDFGFKEIQLKFLSKLGNALNVLEKIDYTADEFLDFWKKSMDYIIELNKDGYDLKETLSMHMIRKILTDQNSNFVDLQNPCGGIISQLAYTQDGDIHTCDEGRMHDVFKLGNVKENTYREITTSDGACSFIAMSTNDGMLCDSCIYKPYCGICPVCAYSETGNPLPILSKNSRCKILMGMFDYLFDKILNDNVTRQVFENWIKN